MTSLAALLLLAAIALVGCTPTPAADQPTPSQPATVLAVTDGDTIRAHTAGRDEIIRIVGVDTPELRPAECYGREAHEFARDRIRVGSTVALRPDPRQPDRDRYGRLLRHVQLGDGSDYALLAVSEGMAVAYSDGRVEVIPQLADAERAARQAGVGMWGVCPA